MYTKAFLISVLLIIFNSSIAYSQENTKITAQESIDRGTVMFESGDYAGAVLEFENAYSLTNNWEILYNIGICNEALRNYVGASDSFTRYLEGGRSTLNSADIRQIEEKLRRLRLMIGTLTIQSNVSGAKILIDEHDFGNVPLQNKQINAGSHKLRLEHDGYEPYEQDIMIQGGQTKEIHIALSRIPEQNNTVVNQETQNQTQQNQTQQTNEQQLITQTEQENRTTEQESEPTPFYKKWWFWTIVGVVVVGAGVGTVLAITKPIEVGVSYDDVVTME